MHSTLFLDSQLDAAKIKHKLKELCSNAEEAKLESTKWKQIAQTETAKLASTEAGLHESRRREMAANIALEDLQRMQEETKDAVIFHLSLS